MLDNSTDNGYNPQIDDNNVDFVVKMDEQAPINDPNCEHLLAKDETDRIGNTVAWMCVQPNCGFGQFLPDDVT